VDSARLFAVPDVVRGVGSLEGLSHSVLGRIAELKAEIRLLELGHKVARPGLDDDGVDLVVDHRLAVQVKSTGRCGAASSRASGSYEFEFRRPLKDGGRGLSVAERRRDVSHIDFFLFYARDIDAWWVVPGQMLSSVSRFRITPGARSDMRWREAWDLLGAE
jgi:hypothetical protein